MSACRQNSYPLRQPDSFLSCLPTGATSYTVCHDPAGRERAICLVQALLSAIMVLMWGMFTNKSLSFGIARSVKVGVHTGKNWSIHIRHKRKYFPYEKVPRAGHSQGAGACFKMFLTQITYVCQQTLMHACTVDATFCLQLQAENLCPKVLA